MIKTKALLAKSLESVCPSEYSNVTQ